MFVFYFLYSIQGFSQTNTYNCYLKNINQIDSKNLEFEICLEWTGTNTQLFGGFQAGIDFNYIGMANGGIITGEFVAGSAGDVGIQQKSPNWNINQSSKQIRMIVAIATQASLAVQTPNPPGFRLGTFRMTNTNDFTFGSTPNFVWKFLNGSNSTTQTKLFFYLYGASTMTDVTTSVEHFIDGNPILDINFIDEKNQFNVFPNPSNGKFNIHFGSLLKNGHLQGFNIFGQQIYNENLAAFNNSLAREIYLNEPEGAYFFRLVMDDKIIVKKIIID